MEGWQRSTRRPPRPQDNDRDDVDENRDDDDYDNDNNHRGAVETNAVESDGANKNRDSPAFAVEAIRQFKKNVIACHMPTVDR